MNRSIRLIKACILSIAAATLPISVSAAPIIGEVAPNFQLADTNGKSVSLSELQGKTVVLEWTNHKCPYVVKHYGSDNMQALQREAAEDDVVWVTIISSAEGKQGYVSAEKANQLSEDRNASPSHILLDTSGEIGKSYEAKTTPHMYVINTEGKLVFKGGIDDKPTTRKSDIEGAKNYVRAALSDLKAGNEVAISTSRPYGCSIKYKS